jgi:O-antigen/teichoic acid export membrane protein
VVGHEPAAFRRELRTAIRLSAWISVAAFVGTPMIAEWLLLLFGPEYAQAKWCLSAFGAATLAVAVKSIYIAVRRTQSRLRLAAKATGWGAVVEIGGAQLGLMLGGITGLGIGLLLGMVVEAIAMWPVVRAAEPPPSTVALADAVSAAEPTSTEPADSDEPVLRRGGR